MKTQQHCPRPPPYPAHLCSVSGALFGIIAFILIAAPAGKAFRSGGKTAGTRGLKVSASTR